MLQVRHNLECLIRVDIRTQTPGPMKFSPFIRRWTLVHSVVIYLWAFGHNISLTPIPMVIVCNFPLKV